MGLLIGGAAPIAAGRVSLVGNVGFQCRTTR
jgi:hypothetical protein